MLECNFCGKTQKEVSQLLSGNNEVHICDRCITLSYTLVRREQAKASEKHVKSRFKEIYKTLKPKEIHAYLNKHVISQERPKKSLSVQIYNHGKKLLNDTEIPIQKSNMLLIGPTGVGKTLLAQKLADLMEVPFIVTDATTLTEHGYAGDDVETLIQKLVQAANGDIARAKYGIIYIDEIDKKAKRNDVVSLSRDVSGEGVQQSLLKLMEGTDVEVSVTVDKKEEKHMLDTTNILFIVSGAFIGLSDVVLERIGKRRIGFSQEQISTNETQWEKYLETQDLIKYGLIPEFVGRLPSVNVLHELNKEDLIKILTEPEQSLVKQYQSLFKLDQVDLEFEREALEAIVDKTLEQSIGARGLKKIMDDLLLDTQYELPTLTEMGVAKIVITKEMVKSGTPSWGQPVGDTVH